jgi:hypothetical protein
MLCFVIPEQGHFMFEAFYYFWGERRVVRNLILGLLAAGNVEKLRRTPIYVSAVKRKEKQWALCEREFAEILFFDGDFGSSCMLYIIIIDG